MKRCWQRILTLALGLSMTVALVACGPQGDGEELECFDRTNLWQEVGQHTTDDALRDELAASGAPATCPDAELDTIILYDVFENEDVVEGPEHDTVADTCCYTTITYTY